MEVRLLRDAPQPGARNMAVDEALMRSAGRGGPTTLRFYGWRPGCLSFGRNQVARGAYDPDAAARRGIQIVRRPTGGRAVYHHREVTYSVAAPAGAWGSLRDAYRRINRALAGGLRELGVPASCAGVAVRGRRAPRPEARACFRDPLPGEVTVEGRKLIGSAQWRDGGALLQHGSLLLADEQHLVELLRSAPHAAGTDSTDGAIALGEVLGFAPPPSELADALARGFELELGVTMRPDGLTAAESREAESLEARYADPQWTWRR